MAACVRLIVILLFLASSVDLYPQVNLHKKNQFDSDCKKQGFWIEVSKSDPGKRIFKGWYKHGNETRKCIYYAEGRPVLKLKYLNDSVMRIRRYDTDGHLQYKGSALWLKNGEELRYCWNGKFSFYNTERRKIAQVMYIKGVEQDLGL